MLASLAFRRMKAGAGPGAVAKIRALDKLLKDVFCISIKGTKFVFILVAAFLLDFASHIVVHNKYIFHFSQAQAAGPGVVAR